jgi:hypothetical protein
VATLSGGAWPVAWVNTHKFAARPSAADTEDPDNAGIRREPELPEQ